MRRRRPEEPVGEILIPVTPMLDMTFQLLFYFIFLFNPNRMIEGFWPVAVSDDVVIPSNSDKPTGETNDEKIINSRVKDSYDSLKVKFDEDRSKSLYPPSLLDGANDSSENHPRPIDAQEIDQIKNEGERKTASEIANNDKQCFKLELIKDVSADNSATGKAQTYSYDDLVKELKERIDTYHKKIEKKFEGTADKKVREAEIAKEEAEHPPRIVISGDKSLRWWRFNQIRDLCYAAGYRDIQEGLPD